MEPEISSFKLHDIDFEHSCRKEEHTYDRKKKDAKTKSAKQRVTTENVYTLYVKVTFIYILTISYIFLLLSVICIYL